MEESHHTDKDYTEAVSMVMAVHDDAEKLERNLPALLDACHEPGFEVIVVDESSSDRTSEVLKQLKTRYEHLYTTYIPASSHYVSRRKLALTVGMKAAKNAWVLITEADCKPSSEEWLNTLRRELNDDVDVVCGYTSYEEGCKASYSFLRLLTWLRQSHTGLVYRYDGACLAVRKEAFMRGNGFLHNLPYLRGEYDFLVNEAMPERVAMQHDLHAWMVQEEPTMKAWRDKQMFYMQTRLHLKHARLSRFLFIIEQVLMHLVILISLALAGYGVWVHSYLYVGIATAALLLMLATRLTLFYRAAKKHHADIAWWKVTFLDIKTLWHYAGYKLRYMLADKQDFCRK